MCRVLLHFKDAHTSIHAVTDMCADFKLLPSELWLADIIIVGSLS